MSIDIDKRYIDMYSIVKDTSYKERNDPSRIFGNECGI
jgi:hypothetical protein